MSFLKAPWLTILILSLSALVAVSSFPALSHHATAAIDYLCRVVYEKNFDAMLAGKKVLRSFFSFLKSESLIILLQDSRQPLFGIQN